MRLDNHTAFRRYEVGVLRDRFVRCFAWMLAEKIDFFDCVQIGWQRARKGMYESGSPVAVCCCMLFFLLEFTFTAQGQDPLGIEMGGVLTVTNSRLTNSAGKPKVNALQFRVVVAGEKWKYEIITEGTKLDAGTGSMTSIPFKKTVACDGTNIFKNLEPADEKQRSQAVVSIHDNANFTAVVGIESECVLWIATCSRHYFGNSRTNESFAPFTSFEASRQGFFQTFTDFLEQSGLPKMIRYQVSAEGLERVKSKAKSDQSTANALPHIIQTYIAPSFHAEYQVKQIATFQGLQLPEAFVLTEFHSTNKVATVVKTFSGIVTNISRTLDLDFSLGTVPKMATVWDQRGGKYSFAYRASNGVLLALSEAEKIGRKTLKPEFTPQTSAVVVASKNPRPIFIIAILISTALFYFFFLQSRRSNTNVDTKP
jgi:hypothetical protein